MPQGLANSGQPQEAAKPRRIRVAIKGPAGVPKHYVSPAPIVESCGQGPQLVPPRGHKQALVKGFFNSSAFGLMASTPVLRRLLDVGASFVFFAFNRNSQGSKKMKIVLRKSTRLRASLSRRIARLALFGIRRGNLV